MDRHEQDPPGEDDFLDRIRQAASRGPADAAVPSDRERPQGSAIEPRGTTPPRPSPLVSSQTADALRALESRVAGLEEQLRRLNEDRARVVADVADAVVARLDARWARSLSEGGGSS
jgi:hypothetical protein